MTSLENRKRWFALALIVAAQFMVVLDVAIVNGARLPLRSWADGRPHVRVNLLRQRPGGSSRPRPAPSPPPREPALSRPPAVRLRRRSFHPRSPDSARLRPHARSPARLEHRRDD